MTMRTLAVLVAAFLLSPALAGTPPPPPDWFNNLRQSDTGASCCSISDCRRTEARWMGGDAGHWEARVPGGNDEPFMEIPKGKVLKNKQSPDGEAYVCASYAKNIWCFVPPNLGF